MAKDSKIQWTDHTWNPWHGCTKVSPGCKYCYMFRDKERYGLDPNEVAKSKTMFKGPLRLKKPSNIFTCSWSDFFIEEADEWRNEAWEIIKQTPHHTYQILTKRPERIKDCLPEDWGQGYSNVLLGVSVENNDLTHRIDTLLATPAKYRFVSFEPLLELIPWKPEFAALDWIIIGGESGNKTGKYKYRYFSDQWLMPFIYHTRISGPALFIKQLGTHHATEYGLKDRHGGDMTEWADSIQIREFPIIK